MRLRRVWLALAFVATGFTGTAAAADVFGLSYSTTNDSLGDQRDRWRSSSEQLSIVFGDEWSGNLPTRFGALWEARARAEIFSPEDLTSPDPADRRYANALVFGAHSHWQSQGWEYVVGADLHVIGPQTGLRSVQEQIHEAFGFPIPMVDGFEIGDRLRPSFAAEAGRPMDLGGFQLRPFVSMDLGAETLVRGGVDLELGGPAGDLKIRQSAAGHRVSVVRKPDERGWRFSLGADVAWVADSVFLPSIGPAIEDVRTRYRAGVIYHGKRASLFYGHTFLSREFVGQREGQRVGTLQLTLPF